MPPLGKQLTSLLRRACVRVTVTLCALCMVSPAFAGSIVWENLGLTSNTSYTSGSTASDGGVTMTTTWSTVTDGGTFTSGDFADFVTYNQGTTGNHSGLLLMSFYNSAKDQDDKITVEFNFDNAVTNLAFTLLDIDDHSLDDTDDFIEVYYHTGDNNWINLAFQTSYWTAGSEIARDNETFGDGWESDNNSRLTDTETTGNLAIDFNTASVQAIRIVYYVGNDQLSGPDVTSYVAISDLTYDDYVPANPLEVTSTADTGSVGTLRYAINYANANAASDDITFNISGTGPFVITAGSGMPVITDAGVTIDGTTQSGASCGDLWSGTAHTLMIEIDGPGSAYGIQTSAANTTIKGLSITDFQVGVVGDSSSSDMVVQCNYIGLNPDGTAAGNTGAGIAVQGSAPQIGGLVAGQGNVISSNYYGILSDNGATGIIVRGNFIGADPAGTAARANLVGINNYTGSSTWSDVSNNLISGNTNQGILFDAGETITGSSGDFQIVGNYIGVDRTGTSALANGNDGISFNGGTVTGVTIGGITSSARNVISGNGSSAMWLSGASDIDIFGNYIGVNAAGTSAIGNASVGIAMANSSSVTIGTGVEAGRNVIGGNGSRGVQVQGTFSNLMVAGNYIGTDSTGNTALSNGYNVSAEVRDAFSMDGGANGTTIAITDNVIGGYSAALIEFWGATASGVTIQGNHVGVGADGSTSIATGSSTEAAVYLGGGTMAWSNFSIGGTGAGEGNIIAYSGQDGIEVSTTGTGNSIAGNTIFSNGGDGVELLQGSDISVLQNAIHSNTGIGIDLGTNGVTANDSGDADTGVNDLLNFPVLNGLYGDGTTSLRYEFTLDAPANTEGYRIEFFKTSVVNGTGYGDAETYVGALETGAHGGGSVDYSGTFTTDIAVSPDDIITVTATSKTGASSYGATSELALNNTMIAPHDYSDSPQTGTSYGTARHDIYSGFYLGSGVTGELSAYDSADASADTDDATTLPSFSQNAAGTIDITVNGTGGYLQAWFDWNGDGDFLDTVDGVLEVLASDVQDGGASDLDATVNGVIQIAFAVPPTATTSQTFGRFRWSTTSGLDSTSNASDGEVEDYAFIITGNALLTASRSVAIYDPTSAGLYAVPGNDIVVTISATNIGGGASDTDSIEFIDEVPSDITFYNGTTSSFGGAVVGWTESSTGLSFTVSSDVAYSNSGTRPATFADCTYTPSAGYDANVRYVCFNPKGQMAAGDPDPTFSVQYRAQIN